MNIPAWLAARPIAHRGLHDPTKAIVENSVAAAAAAVAKGYAIECDVQCTKDGEAVVFHDCVLDRLTRAAGHIGDAAAAEVTCLPYRDGPGTIPALAEFLSAIGERAPVLVEIKSRFDGDMRLAARVAGLAAAYPGRLAVQSFDPDVLLRCRALGVPRPLGLVAQADYDNWEWLSQGRRKRLANLVDFGAVAPDFLAWRASDLPHLVPRICRAGLRMPVIGWTLRDAASRANALHWVDQVIFEGFEP